MRVLLLLTALLCATPVVAQQVNSEQVVENAIDKVIRPGFADFDADAGALKSDMQYLCTTPSGQLLSVARAQFGEVVKSWSRIELLRLGPLLTDNRSERVLFWPDRKGIALRQVQSVLAGADETATDPATLRDKSVALQGLGALEFVLFGAGYEALSTAEGDFRCRYGMAIATLIAGIAGEMNTEWLDPEGISKRLIESPPEDPEFRSSREVIEKLVGLLSHGIEAIRDQRLLPFVGRDGAEPKPRSALFWRSNRTVASIAANFDGLRDLFVNSGLGQTTAEDGAWIADSAAFEFGNVDRAAEVITSPLEEAVADPAQKKALDYLVILTGSLQTLIGENLSVALGLSVGFSSLDGD